MIQPSTATFTDKKRVLVTGGAGYVGSVLVPALLEKGYPVTVLDTFWFWDSTEHYVETLGISRHPLLRLVKGDIRNADEVKAALREAESVIHLACISNDPSSELDPDFTHSVNYGGSLQVIDLAKDNGVKRFIYASSSSVYGIKKEPKVTEDLALEPLTQYSQLKVEVEHYLLHRLDKNFQGVILRPSTVCGYSPRQRLDVVVNILTSSAMQKGKITVFGGNQLRPNIHIKDMVRAYELLMEAQLKIINGKIYNAGSENRTVLEIAQLVQKVTGVQAMEVRETNDPRSYHVCSDKIKEELGFMETHSVEEAIQDLKEALSHGKIFSIEDDRYYNVQRMKRLIVHNNQTVKNVDLTSISSEAKTMKGKRILITGASKGLGYVCAKAFAAEGAQLALMARTQEKLEALRLSCYDPEKHLCIPVDLTDHVQLHKGIEQALHFLGEIDVVVHVAGGGLGLHNNLLSAEEMEKLFALNVKCAAEINRIVAPTMMARSKGNLVHICSIASSEATGSVGYNTVKAALAGYVRSLGREMAESKVIVTGILPGGFLAPENSWARFEARDPEGVRRFIDERLPRKKLGAAEELVPLIKFLCSEQASMMGGCLVPVDAGEGKAYLP